MPLVKSRRIVFVVCFAVLMAGCAGGRGSQRAVQTTPRVPHSTEAIADTVPAQLTISSDPGGLRLYAGVAAEVEGTNFVEDDSYFKGVTPMTISLRPGVYVVALRTPASYDTELLRAWKNTVPQGMVPRNVVARGSCSRFPELFIGPEKDCLMFFGDHGLEWVAKEYHIDVRAREPQEFSVVFQRR